MGTGHDSRTVGAGEHGLAEGLHLSDKPILPVFVFGAGGKVGKGFGKNSFGHKVDQRFLIFKIPVNSWTLAMNAVGDIADRQVVKAFLIENL